MHDVDMIPGVDGYADRAPEQPLVGQGLRPERIHFKMRYKLVAVGRLGRLLHSALSDEQHRQGEHCDKSDNQGRSVDFHIDIP